MFAADRMFVWKSVHVCVNRTYIKQALTCIVQNKLWSKDLRAVIVSCNMNTSLRGPNHIDDQSLNGLITCTTMLCPLLPSISLREDR